MIQFTLEKTFSDILSILEENKYKTSWEIYNVVKNYLETYYKTMINKSHGNLEDQTRRK